MSMIALAQRLRSGPHGLGHSVLLLIGVSAAIIIGLLAMHSLNNHAESTTPVAVVAVHDSGTADHGTTQPGTHEDCADCGDHNSMLAVTCVLVLLAISLLILLPRLGITWGAVLRAGPVEVRRAALFSRPPSLFVLCISRT